MNSTLLRRVVAEFTGTLFLLAAVVGSGIMGERLAGGNVAIALLANAIATGAALVAIILAFGPISGAHLNPAVTLAGGVAGRDRVGRSASLRCRTVHRSSRRSLRGPSDVRHDVVFNFDSCPEWSGSSVQRICRHVWPTCRDLGMRPAPSFHCFVCGRRLHHCGLLVHGFDILRESCRHGSSLTDEYVRRDTSSGCGSFHRGSVRRSCCCHFALLLDDATFAGRHHG